MGSPHLLALNWEEIYVRLRRLVRRLIAHYSVAAWRGQEEDLAEDIVQESIRRFIERQPRVERGEIEPARSPEHMLFTIAYNCCLDLYRRERRLIHTGGEYLPVLKETEEREPADQALEGIYQQELFTIVAREVEHFPQGQRRALLIDLAELMSFDEEPTTLQHAFLKQGIDLSRYRDWPEDRRQHEQRVALRNHAYRRLARLSSIRAYVAGHEH
ncbi:RNA polymerase sigma factor [Thermogemmatispora carboxidivorans]|uniref:RNA polymerase sigma factor n=1 Tax=Thermogemmatispora carboxidivorans TaxID=1382306 RepID=UPI00069C898A|nr:sigma factor [Thermogemmatispora carboxidivorans]